jgi:pyridoxal phosphate enzyme (YggS family)
MARTPRRPRRSSLSSRSSLSLASDIADRLAQVRGRIAEAARKAGRAPDDIQLVAISKTFGLDHVRAAADAGQRAFGENRVQEALQKIGASADLSLEWHLVGHLQSNKARKAAEALAVIHSVDSPELLERIDSGAIEAGRTPAALIQVDLAGEATKHGARPDAVPAILDAAGRCRAVRIRGLMLLPPFLEDAERVRPYFAKLRKLRDDLVARGYPGDQLRELSMGMSHDFGVAIEEGATMVRVGTAIFGSRDV